MPRRRQQPGGSTSYINMGTFGDAADTKGFFQDQAKEQVGSPAVQNLANAMKVRDQRVAASLQNPGTPFVSAGNDMAWDSFFGGLQHTSELAAEHGLKSRVNLAGTGPGTGIGTLGFQRADDHVEHPLNALDPQSPSIAGLRSAANRINRFSR